MQLALVNLPGYLLSRITSNFSHYIYTCAETNGRNFWIQLSAHSQLLRLLPMTSVITGTLDV